jgi:YegS/Rv2252/BmrU family lipid kinase
LNSTTYAKVIVNPAAGAGKSGRLWPEIMSHFKGNGFRFDHHMTEAPGHAAELAREAAKQGYELVVAVGGDGTIHEIVNGLYASGSLGDALLGIVSTGTGSDYIRTVGLSRNYKVACQSFISPKIRAVDLGKVEYRKNGKTLERLFVNFAGAGFDAEIARRTQQTKLISPLVSYLTAALTTLVTYKNKDVLLKLDGVESIRKVCTVIMNNGRYGGGGMFTAPNAELSDGLFDVLIVGDISKPDFLVSLPRLYKGTHLTHRKVTMKQAKEIEIESRKKMSLQADGELLGELPARISVMPSALKIII